MSQEEIVSVILPSYNSKQLLCASIKSVLKQSYPDFELLIIDDCSTDQETLDLLNDYAGKDERVNFIFNDKKMGLDKARNLAVTFAGGKYVTFMHPGDSFSSTFLERMVDINEENGTDIAICHVESYRGLKHELFDEHDCSGLIPKPWLETAHKGNMQLELSRDDLLKEPCQIFNSYLSQGKVINLESYKKNGLQFRDIYAYSDVDWAARLLLSYPKYSLDPSIGVCSLSVEPSSILRLSEKLINGMCETIKQRYNILHKLNQLERAKQTHLVQSLRLFMDCVYHNQGTKNIGLLKSRCLQTLQNQGYTLEQINLVLPLLRRE